MLLALPALSCRTVSENTSTLRSDRLAWDRKVSVTLATIPTSLATLTAHPDSLRSLPPGAAYTARSGQATVRLEMDNGRIRATASCDSLQQLVVALEEQLHQSAEQAMQQEKEIKPFTTPLRTKLEWFLSGIIISILIILIYYKNGKTNR